MNMHSRNMPDGAESVKGQNAYLRYVGRDEEERCEQRKAARLALDTSAHAGSDFRRFVRQLSSPVKIGLQ